MNHVYRHVLEQNPALLEQFEHIRGDPELISLRDEVALAKTLLAQLVSILSRASTTTGKISGEHLGIVLNALKEVSGVVDRAAAIEDRKGTSIGVNELTAFIIGLKMNLTQDLTNAGMQSALPLIENRLAQLPWPNVGDEMAKEMVNAHTDIDVRFRVLRRKGEVEAVDEDELDDDGHDGNDNGAKTNGGRVSQEAQEFMKGLGLPVDDEEEDEDAA